MDIKEGHIYTNVTGSEVREVHSIHYGSVFFYPIRRFGHADLFSGNIYGFKLWAHKCIGKVYVAPERDRSLGFQDILGRWHKPTHNCPWRGD